MHPCNKADPPLSTTPGASKKLAAFTSTIKALGGKY
jgi:hypothetical protein